MVRNFIKQNITLSLLFWLAIMLAVGEMVIMVLYREFWVDEMFSAFRGYLVWKGELIPFKNGIFQYPPLIIPTYGLVQYLFGPSFYAGRIFSAVLFAALLILSYVIACHIGGKRAGISVLWLAVSNLLLVGNFVSATMYSLVGIFILGAVLVSNERPTSKQRIIIASLLLGFAMLARTNMLVAYGAYFIFLYVMRARLKHFMLSMLVFSLVLGAGYLPLIIHNPVLGLAFFGDIFGNFGPLSWLPPSLKTGSFALGEFLNVLAGFIKEYFGFLLLFLLSCVALALRSGRDFLRVLQSEPAYAFLLILSLVLMGAHFFYPRIIGHVYYANYFIMFMAIAGAGAMFKFFRANEFTLILITTVALLNFGANLFRTDVISSPAEESDIQRVLRGAKFLSENTRPESKILVFDNSITHVFLADRRTYNPLINRDFLFIADSRTNLVRDSGFYNLAMLKQWAEQDADYIAIHEERWPSSFLRSLFWKTDTENVQEQLIEIQKIFSMRYELVGRALNVYPRKYTEGNDGGTLLLYKRKNIK